MLSDAFDRVDPNCEALDSVVGTLTGESKGLKRPTFYRGDGAGASGMMTAMTSSILHPNHLC